MQVLSIVALIFAQIIETVDAIKNGFTPLYWIATAVFVPAIVGSIYVAIRSKK